ncbi:MAG: TIGR00730 family Rossman fold protein [Bdellovibrionales bacterium]|nr:TIGR00730 family Rossman fold protein [Bdellovibrionales bacterium]
MSDRTRDTAAHLFRSASEFGDYGLRIFRESWELLQGAKLVRDIDPAVTVFGSARFGGDHPYARVAEDLGRRLAEAGYTVMSGAGPGVMEAVSRGAKKAGGRTVGANIVIPSEQRSNPYIDRSVTFSSFGARKAMLTRHSRAFVVLPGGYGTLDELTDVLCLIQAGKMKPVPVILIDPKFWEGWTRFCRDTLLTSGAITEELLGLFEVVATPEEAVARLRG